MGSYIDPRDSATADVFLTSVLGLFNEAEEERVEGGGTGANGSGKFFLFISSFVKDMPERQSKECNLFLKVMREQF